MAPLEVQDPVRPAVPAAHPAQPGGFTRPGAGYAQRWRDFRRQGVPAVWATGATVLVILLMLGGMLGLVLSKGLVHLWPHGLTQVATGTAAYLGPVVEREQVRAEAGREERDRILIKIGNRDVYGLDFRWFDRTAVTAETRPEDAVVVERRENGDFHGYLRRIVDGGTTVAEGAGAWDALGAQMHAARVDARAARAIDAEIEDLRAPVVRLDRKIEAAGRKADGSAAALQAQRDQEAARIEAQSLALESERDTRLSRLAERTAVFETADGREKAVRLDAILRAYRPNSMSTAAKIRQYAAKLHEFVFDGPRESNTEGGIFPALFGTLLMVLLMTIAVVPLGVVAALYLHEYARPGFPLRMIRLAVANLAGVPSIVFGMFGLAFFVYGVGGTIDRTFFSGTLPNPTFGTGGVLWASLTLALLALPVVIVATEEGLSAVPRANREGALALGATQWQTLWHVVLPNALPGILTGAILAVSRGAGEVAPLMLTGVVKLAPDLAVDGTFPFLHLERKFMHLGFHIYDVSMQSPNVEAAKPMVYTTTLLLLALVVALNAAAIVLRNRTRRRYRGATL